MELPPPAIARRNALAMAVLDAVLSPDWQHRYYSFQADWDDSEWMASMRDASGDHWFMIGIDTVGLAIKVLAHESEAYAAGSPNPLLIDAIPTQFHGSFRDEEAFELEDVSFVAWCWEKDMRWKYARTGLPDGAEPLLNTLSWGADAYRRWAGDYYKQPVSAAVVDAIFAGEPLTESLARQLNPTARWNQIRNEVAETGYPIEQA